MSTQRAAMKKSHSSPKLWQKVAALCDGTRTAQDIAVELDVMPEYVNATIRRKGLQDKVLRTFGRRKAQPTGIDSYLAAKIDPDTRQAIIERAVAANVSVAAICGTLLRVAVEVGDLDTHFPVEAP